MAAVGAVHVEDLDDIRSLDSFSDADDWDMASCSSFEVLSALDLEDYRAECAEQCTVVSPPAVAREASAMSLMTGAQRTTRKQRRANRKKTTSQQEAQAWQQQQSSGAPAGRTRNAPVAELTGAQQEPLGNADLDLVDELLEDVRKEMKDHVKPVPLAPADFFIMQRLMFGGPAAGPGRILPRGQHKVRRSVH
jgi:hypothetical protein